MVWHTLACGGIPTLCTPLSDETLDPLEKNHAYKTTAGTGVKMG